MCDEMVEFPKFSHILALFLSGKKVICDLLSGNPTSLHLFKTSSLPKGKSLWSVRVSTLPDEQL